MVNSFNSGNSEVLITRDLLGSLTKTCKSKLEEELHVPDGLDNHMNFKTDTVCPKRCIFPSSPISSSSSCSSCSSKNKRKKESFQVETLQDLNYPPSSSAPQSNLFQETSSLDLNLDFSSRYQSVCTLDNVKYALERAEKQAKQQLPSSSSCPQSKDDDDDEETNSSDSDMFAAGCPSCLFYVIALRANPKCPRCNSFVPSPLPFKKPRINLNASV